MATNSHLVIEVKGLSWNTDGWSIWAEDIAESNWYRMYDAMAGGRGTTGLEPVVPPRGIPDDADDCTKDFFARLGGHTESWLTPNEYVDALGVAHRSQHEAFPAFMLGTHDEWSVLGRVLATLRDLFGNDGVRLVMAFDN